MRVLVISGMEKRLDMLSIRKAFWTMLPSCWGSSSMVMFVLGDLYESDGRDMLFYVMLR